MKILDVKSLAIEEIKVIKFGRFLDHRGYFSEPYRKSDLSTLESMKGIDFVQTNESFSYAHTVRGLHFQWNPFMGKLVRTLAGHMIDMVLDIRKGSPSFGKIVLYDMPYKRDLDNSEWIWIPPGFAHGNFFLEDSTIEYFCSGEYSQGCEAGISPLAKDIDWSLATDSLKQKLDRFLLTTDLISEKDKNGLSVKDWEKNEQSNNFIFGKL